MSFLHPAALALFALAAILIFLAFLRAMTRQQAVSSLALWAGLTQSAERQKPKLHPWAEPILFIQLLVLAAMVFTVAQPTHRARQTALRGLALILDETASMRTEEAPGVTRFAHAVERARAILAESPASQVALIEFSSRSHVAVPPTADPAAVSRALAQAEPSWRGDGSTSDLLNLLTAVGGLDRYDRFVLLSDHTPPDLPGQISVERFDGGQNVGITAFTVRTNPTGPGVTAFVELRNDTAEYLEPRVTLRDEFTSVTVSLAVGPESTERYVSPFSASRGAAFMASLAVDDDYPGDNVRYFSLDRPSGLRVRWIGDDNPYLRAALESVLQARITEVSDPVDLTVVVGRSLAELPAGNVLLLASDVPSLYRFSTAARQVDDTAQANDPADPLLAGIDSGGIYVETLPETFFVAQATQVLTAGGLPLLSTIHDGDRTVFIFSTDLRGTNLPITVEFPVLVRNVLSLIARVPGPLAHEWLTVGGLLDVGGSDSTRVVRSPDGSTVPVDRDQTAIIADEPGFYEVRTARDTREIAVNVPPGESLRALEAPGSTRTAPPASSAQDVMRRLWPLFAWLALALLAIEAGLYLRFDAARKVE